MYRNQYHIYPKPKRSSTPDISLPPLLKTEKEWHEIRKVIFLDESLNDSGAALYIDGKYIPNRDESGIDFGLALTVSPRWDRQRRCVEFGNWLSSLIEDHEPDIIVGKVIHLPEEVAQPVRPPWRHLPAYDGSPCMFADNTRLLTLSFQQIM